MKTKKVFNAVMCLFVCLLCSVAVHAEEKGLSGVWSYSAPEAPYGYEAGEVEFKQVDGTTEAHLKIDGYSSTVAKVKKQGEAFVCTAFIDGTEVYITLTFKDGKLTGTAEGGGMLMNVKFTPKK